MAGSLNHIVDEQGRFDMDSIENLRDAREALEECFHIIREFEELYPGSLKPILRKLHYPVPGAPMVNENVVKWSR